MFQPSSAAFGLAAHTEYHSRYEIANGIGCSGDRLSLLKLLLTYASIAQVIALPATFKLLVY